MKTSEAEINRYFCEKVFKKCWHEIKRYMPNDERCSSYCRICNKNLKSSCENHQNRFVPDKCNDFHLILICKKCWSGEMNPDYFSKEGFWDVWEWAIEQDWWDEFQQVHDCIMDHRFYALDLKCINYKSFAREVYDFLEGKK